MCLQVKILVLCFASITLSGVRAVYTESNAYKGVTIAFSPSIKESEVNSTKLKNVIQKASELLYLATRRRAFFSEIDLLYPSTWTTACEQNSPEEKQPERISVYVTGSKNRNGENLLRAQHSKGCGVPGDVIYMSPAWLDGDEEELSREFVQQWAIYRYGVFEEIAEPEGWPCYTKDGKHWKQSGCYSVDISVDLFLDDKGLPSCETVDIADYHNLSSSLMSSVSSLYITDFCDGSKLKPHDPVAPTRHNRICRGKPVWSVIKESEDFSLGKNLPKGEDFKPPDVSFRCFQERKNYFIFAVQVKPSQDGEKIVVDVRLSLLRFLLYEVWPETQVSIITFGETAKDPFHLDLTQPGKVFEHLDEEVRPRSITPDVCFSCGLKNAFNLSRRDENAAVVFVAFANALMNQSLGELIDILESAPSRIYMIIIQDTQNEFTAPNLIRATRKTGGEVFIVAASLAVLPTRMTIFLTRVLQNPLGIQGNVAIIHQSIFNINDETFKDEVEADAYIEGKMTYTLTCNSDRYRIDNPTDGTECSTLPNMKTENEGCGYSTTLTNETSLRKWTFFVHDYGGPSPVTCSSIATVQLKANYSDLLTVRGWMNTDTVTPGLPSQNALIIYAEIMYNSMPVTNAAIQATVYGSASSTPTTIQLLDSGNGDPDTKKGDGIYSRYFTRINEKGLHSVVIQAKGDLRSHGPTHTNQDRMRFSRIVPAGSFVVTEQPKQMDYHPPNRIGDLRVVSIDHNNSIVTLQWTAPGDNYDDGTAKRYNVKFSQTRSNLEEVTFEAGNLESIENIGQEVRMVSSGELQEFTIHLPPPETNRPYYLAIQAVNKNNDASKISNIVQIFFTKSAPVAIRTTTTTTAVPGMSLDISDVTYITQSNSSEFANSTSEGLTETNENWENRSTTESTTNSITTISVNTTGKATNDPQTHRSDACGKKIIIMASSIGSGIIALFLIINAIVCSICFRKQRKPKQLSKKAALRPPYNITIVNTDGPTTVNDCGVSGHRRNVHENMQDFELDADYIFVPGSQRKKGRNENYYTSETGGNVGFTNRSFKQRFTNSQESTNSESNTLRTVREQNRRNYKEDDDETGAVSLGVV